MTSNHSSSNSDEELYFHEILDEVERSVAELKNTGDVARYIPELAKVSPDQFGLALHLTDDRSFHIGDAHASFSIQSMSKVLTLALAMKSNPTKLWKRVGVEPSGNAFNSLVQLEDENGIPRNPLINAGALVVADSLLDEGVGAAKTRLLEFVSELGGGEAVHFDHKVAHSEYETSARNRALANFMKSFGNLHHSVDDVIDFYCHQCAIALSCTQASRIFSFLAKDPSDQQSIPGLSETKIRRINALMLTCGFYDESGEFAFRIGLPGKSGVGGGIVAVCPSQFTLCAWSPRLGPKGNSVRATRALERFVQLTGASIF